MTVKNTPELAIVGGGIVGLICALGLIDCGINVRVYEQADGLRENGAGLAFTRNAVECLKLVSPLASEALRSVQTPNGDTTHPNDHLQWVDGFNQHDQNDQCMSQCYSSFLSEPMDSRVVTELICWRLCGRGCQQGRSSLVRSYRPSMTTPTLTR
jgi:uncharacterized NAD(P)/FAD-binding protein YdhS